jgi:hypothetical protein
MLISKIKKYIILIYFQTINIFKKYITLTLNSKLKRIESTFSNMFHDNANIFFSFKLKNNSI